MRIDIRPINVIIALILVAVYIIILLIGCSPRYCWRYWLPDKKDVRINFGGYEIVLVIISPDSRKKDSIESQLDYYDFIFSFETFYRDPISSIESRNSVPIIIIDSAYTIQPPKTSRTYLKLRCLLDYISEKPDSTRLIYRDNEWMGPKFLTNQVIHKGQKELIVGFKIVIRDRITHKPITSNAYRFELTQFRDRYWIMAQ